MPMVTLLFVLQVTLEFDFGSRFIIEGAVLDVTVVIVFVRERIRTVFICVC
jgi:hypothetical protein